MGYSDIQLRKYMQLCITKPQNTDERNQRRCKHMKRHHTIGLEDSIFLGYQFSPFGFGTSICSQSKSGFVDTDQLI